MAKKPAEPIKNDSDKLEPKLTILKKRNPEVYEWVKGLSRGKLTQFIYEVMDTYMENGFLLKDSWVHPTDDKSMQLLNANRGGNVDLSEVMAQLSAIQQQLNYIATNMHNSNPNAIQGILSALVGQAGVAQQGFNQTQHFPPVSTHQSQGFYQNTQPQPTQNNQQPLSSTHTKNSDTPLSDSLVFTLEEPQVSAQNESSVGDSNSDEVQSFASSNGFAVY